MLRLTLLILSFAACGVAGAIPPAAMRDADADSIRGRHIAVVKARGLHVMYVYTPLRNLLMLPGAIAVRIPIPQVQTAGAFITLPTILAAHLEGYVISIRNGVDDPALTVANTLAVELADAYDLIVVEGRPDRDALVLVVATRRWGIDYLWPEKAYGAKYQAQLTLRDRANRRTLVQTTCRARRSAEIASYDALLADGAALLKTTVAGAAETCADEFREALTLP